MSDVLPDYSVMHVFDFPFLLTDKSTIDEMFLGQASDPNELHKS